jgi:hypothetical protein
MSPCAQLENLGQWLPLLSRRSMLYAYVLRICPMHMDTQRLGIES